MYCTRRSDVTVSEVDGETLVLDGEGGQIHQLNATASFVWHRCDGKTAISDIARLFAREFDVEAAVAAKDVADVVEKLRELELLVTE